MPDPLRRRLHRPAGNDLRLVGQLKIHLVVTQGSKVPLRITLSRLKDRTLSVACQQRGAESVFETLRDHSGKNDHHRRCKLIRLRSDGLPNASEHRDALARPCPRRPCGTLIEHGIDPGVSSVLSGNA